MPIGGARHFRFQYLDSSVRSHDCSEESSFRTTILFSVGTQVNTLQGHRNWKGGQQAGRPCIVQAKQLRRLFAKRERRHPECRETRSIGGETDIQKADVAALGRHLKRLPVEEVKMGV